MLRKFMKARAFVAVAALSVLASACLGGGGGEQQTGPSPGKKVQEPTSPVTITFSSWVGESPQMKKFAKEFQELHPNITIEFQNVPAEQSTDKLLTRIAGGNAPDTAFVDMGAVGQFADKDAVVNLDAYIAQSDLVDANDFLPAWKSGSSLDGHMFGLPFDGESTGLFYRTDLFEAAGISSAPTTWDEFKSVAEQLTDPSKRQYGFILFAPESAYYWYPWLWGAGGDLLTQDGQHVAFNSPEGQQAAEFYVGLREQSPPDYYNSNSWDGRIAFAEGKVAMYEAGSWFGGQIMNEFPKTQGKWSAAPMPVGPSGQCATTIAGDSLVIFNQTQNADAAWLWIEYLDQQKTMLEWNKAASLIPPRQSIANDPSLFEKQPFLQGFAENMKCGVTSNIQQAKWYEVEQKLNDKLGAAIYGDISPTEALQQAAEQGEKILSG